MTDKPTAYKFRVITFGVPDTNGDIIMRTAINENDLISLVEKKEILDYTLTDDYVDVSVDASRFSVNVAVSNLMDTKDGDKTIPENYFQYIAQTINPLMQS